MKKTMLIITFAGIALCLFSASVGKIRFLVGEVQYKQSLNLTYKPATLNMEVEPEGYIKTCPDSKAEIQWNNGSVAVINANTQISISKLQSDALANPNYTNKLRERINNLRAQNEQREASQVAGIRREEAEIIPESELYWYSEPKYKVKDALNYMDIRDYTKAVEIFEKVIEQSPLDKDAELSHTCLIMIYDELGDKVNLQKHIKQLKEDFPDSSALDSLPPEK